MALNNPKNHSKMKNNNNKKWQDGDVVPLTLKPRLVELCKQAASSNDADQPSFVKECWIADTDQYFKQTTHEIKTKLSSTDALNNVQNVFNSSEEEPTTKRKVEVIAKADQLTHQKRIINIQYRLLLAEQSYEELEVIKEQIDKECNKLVVVLRKTGMEKPLVYPAISACMALGEIPFSFSVLQSVLSIPVWMIYILCTLIAFLFGASAHFATKGWLRDEKPLSILAISIGLAILTVQVILRLQMSGENHIVLALLNASIFGANVLFAAWANLYKDQRAVNKALKDKADEIIKYKVEIDNEKNNQELIDVYKTITMLDETEKVKKAVQRRQAEQVKKEQEFQKELYEIEEYREACIAYGNLRIKEAFESGRKKRDRFNLPKSAAIVLLLLFTAISGCKSDIDKIRYDIPKTKEVFLVWDKSESALDMIFDNESAISNHVLNKILNINDPMALYDGARIYLSIIGEPGLPQITVIELPVGDSVKLNRVKLTRRRQVDSFKKAVISLIDSFVSIPADQKATNLHRSQCYILKQLKRSTFSKNKQFYMYTDGIESSLLSNSIFNIEDLQQLKTNKEEMVKHLDNDCNVGDLTSIKIYMVGSPQSIQSDEVYKAVGEFWAYYYQTHNAEVEILSNLY